MSNEEEKGYEPQYTGNYIDYTSGMYDKKGSVVGNVYAFGGELTPEEIFRRNFYNYLKENFTDLSSDKYNSIITYCIKNVPNYENLIPGLMAVAVMFIKDNNLNNYSQITPELFKTSNKLLKYLIPSKKEKGRDKEKIEMRVKADLLRYLKYILK